MECLAPIFVAVVWVVVVVEEEELDKSRNCERTLKRWNRFVMIIEVDVFDGFCNGKRAQRSEEGEKHAGEE